MRDTGTYPIRFIAHRNRDGEEFYAQACRDGWEGLVAKKEVPS